MSTLILLLLVLLPRTLLVILRPRYERLLVHVDPIRVCPRDVLARPAGRPANWPAKDMADSGEEMVGQEWSSGVGGGQRGERRRRVGRASSKRKGVAIFKALFLAIRKPSFGLILEYWPLTCSIHTNWYIMYIHTYYIHVCTCTYMYVHT